MADQKKINKNNRARGSHFEKVGADFLEMDVVPYSGSNARFGYGDVRDSKWLGEFKNITPKDGRVCIKQEWITDNASKSRLYGLMPFLGWMPAGKSEKYVILDPDIFTLLKTECDIIVEIPKKSVVAVNIFIDINDSCLKPVKNGDKSVKLVFGDICYYMMSMSTFKSLINSRGLKGARQEYAEAKCAIPVDRKMVWSRL
jgi:hypothetical protein